MKINKALLTYTGINRDKAIPQNQQFSVEITAEELNRIKQFPFPQTFTGKVVKAGDKSKREIGHFATNWCNPFNDFYRFHNAGWKIDVCACEGSFHNEHCAFKIS